MPELFWERAEEVNQRYREENDLDPPSLASELKMTYEAAKLGVDLYNDPVGTVVDRARRVKRAWDEADE
ncbi:hypothetical protein [Streptomyces sp. NPDC089799]|uniref:hypothetical protein n=1 Tax=Streptomyces sp. NPDC089799 TaxID=3155066 RepID=UPI00342E6A96